MTSRVLVIALSGALAACSSADRTASRTGGAGHGDAGADGAADAGPKVSLLVGPPELRGANGMRFGADGTLYVGSESDKKVYLLDPETGETKASWGSEHGISGPDDLVIAPDGTMYIANILQGTIVAVAPSGDNHVVATPGPGVDGIALSPDGKLVVGKDFLGDGLYVVDPTGTEPVRTVNAQPGWINAMAYGPDGVLYAPVWQKHYVARLDVESGTVTQFSKEFSGTAGAVKFSSKGELYAVDGGVGDVYRIDTASGELTALLHYGMPLDNLAFDASDRLYVSSYGDGSVSELMADGTLRVVKAAGLLSPAALAVSADASESVYIGDSNGVPEYDGVKGQRRGGFGNGIAVGTRITAPIALRVDGDRLLALSPSSVQSWDRATGAVTSTLQVSGGVDLVQFQGSTLVSRPSGDIVTATDAGTTPYATGLGDPAGLAATDTELFVAIYSAGEIRQIAEAGQPLATPRVIATGLSFPEGLAVLPGGDLVVVETGTGDVVRVNRTTGEKTVVAPGLSAGTPAGVGQLNAIGVGASGHAYVLSPTDRSVSRITL